MSNLYQKKTAHEILIPEAKLLQMIRYYFDPRKGKEPGKVPRLPTKVTVGMTSDNVLRISWEAT